MKTEGCGRRRRGALGMSGVLAAGLLANRGVPAAVARAGAGSAESMAVLARAQQAEERIMSGRVVLTRSREQHSLKERGLRTLIKQRPDRSLFDPVRLARGANHIARQKGRPGIVVSPEPWLP
jgi:hypothetical protein